MFTADLKNLLSIDRGRATDMFIVCNQ